MLFNKIILKAHNLYEELSLLARKHSRLITVSSLALFLSAIVTALIFTNINVHDISLLPLVLIVALLAPITLLINTLRVHVAYLSVNGNGKFSKSMRTALISSAANHLPVPGGVFTRIGHIASGIPGNLGKATALTIASMLYSIVIGATGLLLTISTQGKTDISLAYTLIPCGIALAGITIWLRSLIQAGYAYQLLGIEILAILTEGARLWACLLALNTVIQPLQAISLALNAVVGSLFGLAPGGLGIREIAGAGLASIIDIPATAVIIAIAINRILGMTVMALALIPWLRTGGAHSS